MPCDLHSLPGFCIGPLPLHWYGIIIVTGILIGGFVAAREARRRGENSDRVWDALIIVAVAGIVGARLYHVLSDPAGCTEAVPGCGWPWYQNHPADIVLMMTQGGLGIFGALIAGGLAAFIYLRRNHLSFARYLDIAAPAILIGQAIGRWGNFVNQELYGPPTTLPWGILIDKDHRYGDFVDMIKYPESTRFHPDFLYESVLNTIGFIALVIVARKFANRLKEGDLILLYMIWYPLVRILVESLRPDAWIVAGGGLATAQLVSLVMIVIAIAVLIFRHRRQPQPTEPSAPGSA